MSIVLSSFLKQAVTAEIVQWMETLETAELAKATLRALKVEQPEKANDILCSVFDVACYKVGDSCFAAKASSKELDKWFVSTIGGDFDQRETARLGLSDSHAQAQAQAVSVLKLENRFFNRFPL